MNVEPRHPHPSESTTGKSVIDLQTRRYGKMRRRRKTERLARQRQHQLSAEAADILRFALIWAPYGGVPADETFQKFGMSTRRFIERLWQTIEEAECNLHITNQFASVYPRHTVLRQL